MIYTSASGTKWYLHTKKTLLPRNKIWGTTYYFKKDIDEDHYFKGDLPIKYQVIETHSGMPVVKRI